MNGGVDARPLTLLDGTGLRRFCWEVNHVSLHLFGKLFDYFSVALSTEMENSGQIQYNA